MPQILVLYLKEVKHFLRDRRTITSLLVAPIVLNCLLLFGFSNYMNRVEKAAEEKVVTLAFREQVAVPGLRDALQQAKFHVQPSATPRQDTESKKTEAGLDVAPTTTVPQIYLYGDFSSSDNLLLKSRLEKAVGKLKEQQVRASVQRAGLPLTVLTPFQQATVNTAPTRKVGGNVIGQILPLILVQFMLIGALYPAMDMTAGEKERKTIEMTLMMPISRITLVFSKLLAIITSSAIATTLTVASYAITLRQMQRGGSMKGGMASLANFSVDPTSIALIVLALLPMLTLIAALMLAAGSAARSAQEGNSYAMPIMLVSIFLSIASLLPGLPHDFRMNLLPSANFALVVKQLLTGEWSAPAYLLTIGANLVYATIAVLFAIRCFTKESMLFRS